jgi:PilZ domain
VNSDIRALVISPDQNLLSMFKGISCELGIDTDASESQMGIPNELQRERYEALLVDADGVADAIPIVKWVRASSCHAGVVVFAVATDPAVKQYALSQGVNFAFERPLRDIEFRRALWASYAAMTQERRRYFRLSVDLPVEVNVCGRPSLLGRTVNVSSEGLCVVSPAPLSPGDIVSVAFIIPELAARVKADGIAVWDDKHGKSGIRLQRMSASSREALDRWLDAHFMRSCHS